MNMKYWLRSRKGRKAVSFYLFISPWLIGFILLTVVVMILGFVTSLTNYDGFSLQGTRFVFLQNYRNLLSDPEAWLTLKNTFVFALISVPLILAISGSLALLINRGIGSKGTFRSLFFLPSVVPVVAAASMWRLIADKNAGLINGIISLIRPGTAVNWLSDYSFLVLLMLIVWSQAGSGMVIFLAALQGVPKELREAALIDGANGWQIFKNITIPITTPVIFFQLILGIIVAMQIFIQPLLLSPSGYVTAGGGNPMAALPVRSIFMFTNYIWRQMFANSQYGYGIAAFWVLFLVIIFLGMIVFRSSRYWVYYEVN